MTRRNQSDTACMCANTFPQTDKWLIEVLLLLSDWWSQDVQHQLSPVHLSFSVSLCNGALMFCCWCFGSWADWLLPHMSHELFSATDGHNKTPPSRPPRIALSTAAKSGQRQPPLTASAEVNQAETTQTKASWDAWGCGSCLKSWHWLNQSGTDYTLQTVYTLHVCISLSRALYIYIYICMHWNASQSCYKILQAQHCKPNVESCHVFCDRTCPGLVAVIQLQLEAWISF